MIDILRWVYIALWLLVVVITTASFIRFMSSRARGRDTTRAAVWFVAAVLVGFGFRWVLYPHPELAMGQDEAIYWSGVYLLGALAAPFLAAAVWTDA